MRSARLIRTIALAGALSAGCNIHEPTGPGSLATITVTPNPTLAINATQQFIAVGRDAEGAVVVIAPVWTIEAGGGAIDLAGLFTAGTVPGAYTATVKATSGGMSGTATVTVIIGPLATITVTPNPSTLPISGTQQFTAVGRDAGGNVVAIVPTWSAASGGAIDAAGLFTAGTVAGTFPNAVQATSGTIAGTATVIVTAGALATLTVTPDPATLPINGVQQFTALGRDTGGNVVAISPVWLLVAGGGSLSGAGVFTAGTVPGTFSNTVRATSGSVSGTATVIVTVGPLASIAVAPDPATLPINGVQQFTAVGRDAGGNVVVIAPAWTVVAGGGSISGAGLFTAGTVVGTFPNTVRAASGSVSGTATVIVTVGGVATMTVTPDPVTLVQGATQQFTAVARDIGGNVVLAITPTWSVVAGGGGINTAGLFTAGGVDGTFLNSVRATSGSISGFATVTVTSVPPTPPLVPLGAAATHGILGGSTVTCVDLGLISADVSVWAGSAITGFPPCVITGVRHAGDAFAQTAQASLTTAYNQLDAMPCGAILTADLGGQTLQPGVYCSLSSQGLTGEMFLDALGDPNASFVIKAASTLTTAAARVTLLNGAQARNVYWLVGSSATLGVGSAMKGNIVAFTSITLIDNATLLGRALARNGAVTLGTNNVITLP